MEFLVNTFELCAYQLLQIKTYILLAIIISFIIFLKSTKKRSKLPPGPRGIPILGYLPFISSNEPHFQLESLRKKYGDVFGLYLGSKYAVFIGDVDKCKEAYNMDEFSGRPDGAFPLSSRCSHFGAIQGQPWKLRRKVATQSLRQLGVGSQMIQTISNEHINGALKKLDEELILRPKENINVRPFLNYVTTSVVLNFVVGKTFPQEHSSYKTVDKFLRFFAEKGSSLSLDVLIPWTKPILSTLTAHGQETRKIFEDMDKFTRNEIENHRRNPPDTPKDFIDYSLKHFKDQLSSTKIDDICGDAQLMIFGGADTVRATTEWFLLSMAQLPEIQEKVFREIDDVLGPSADVYYEDRVNLPYTEATILESFRYNLLAPLNPFHSSVEEKSFSGYTIPKDSLVFAMLWTVHNDPRHWKQPNKFYPENFLNADKTKVTVPDAFLPFAPGKRICVGDKVALIESYIFCVHLIRHFQILPPDGGIKRTGTLRINREPTYPVVKLVKR